MMAQSKRLLRIACGFLLLLTGVPLLVLPGPGWALIIAGLALLAAEYVWARRTLDVVKRQAQRLRPQSKNGSPATREAPPPPRQPSA